MAIDLLASPGMIDVVLALVALELGGLVLVRRRTGHGLATSTLMLMLLPGICLLLAVRAALAGGATRWVPAALVIALVAHLADLRHRWRG
jgi:hypothetical protein